MPIPPRVLAAARVAHQALRRLQAAIPNGAPMSFTAGSLAARPAIPAVGDFHYVLPTDVTAPDTLWVCGVAGTWRPVGVLHTFAGGAPTVTPGAAGSFQVHVVGRLLGPAGEGVAGVVDVYFDASGGPAGNVIVTAVTGSILPGATAPAHTGHLQVMSDGGGHFAVDLQATAAGACVQAFLSLDALAESAVAFP